MNGTNDMPDTMNWDMIAPKYDDLILSPLHPEMVACDEDGVRRNPLIDDLENRINTFDEPTVLDFGCGVGNLMSVCDLEEANIVGVDLSRVSLSLAEAQAAVNGVSFEAIHGDLLNIRLDKKFETIVSVNSILPPKRWMVGKMLDTVTAHLAPDSGRFIAILPSFDTTEYLSQLWHNEYHQLTEMRNEADRAAELFFASKLRDPVELKYADDGKHAQCYHTANSIVREFTVHGLRIVEGPKKVYYPWKLCQDFDYGYFPKAPEEIWAWYVIAEAPEDRWSWPIAGKSGAK